MGFKLNRGSYRNKRKLTTDRFKNRRYQKQIMRSKFKRRRYKYA